eukprot:TRINITY_DN7186_c0_g1_i1.p1 TRINITY_DN7186_c0_g1~~TRINITY_DN7186_c0_g1_i1.p1  ORF type:complete len:141 (-),score=26.65 TRINITY_DN7186_c0_g1_i1:22-444(-)
MYLLIKTKYFDFCQNLQNCHDWVKDRCSKDGWNDMGVVSAVIETYFQNKGSDDCGHDADADGGTGGYDAGGSDHGHGFSWCFKVVSVPVSCKCKVILLSMKKHGICSVASFFGTVHEYQRKLEALLFIRHIPAKTCQKRK